MDVIETLNKMKDVLIEGGWCRVELEDEQGQHCLVGARNKVLGIPNIEQGQYEHPIPWNPAYMADYISDLLESVAPISEYDLEGREPYKTCIWKFNDKCKSINEVLDVIDDAILAEKERVA